MMNQILISRQALERAKTALEHRLHVTETVMLPQARERRNLGIIEALEEGIFNDRATLKESTEALKQ